MFYNQNKNERLYWKNISLLPDKRIACKDIVHSWKGDAVRRSQIKNMIINGRNYVLVNKARFFTFILIVIGLIFFIFFSTKVAGSGGQEQEETFVQYTVSVGDTLWDIANSYRNSTEIRKYISRLMELNQLTSADITAGDTLVIPIMQWLVFQGSICHF